MPYSYPDNIPTFAKNKKAPLQKRIITLFNETLSRTDSEESARRAALAFMSNYEQKYGKQDKKNVKKSVEDQESSSGSLLSTKDLIVEALSTIHPEVFNKEDK